MESYGMRCLTKFKIDHFGVVYGDRINEVKQFMKQFTINQIVFLHPTTANE